jgi:hypothetical protein
MLEAKPVRRLFQEDMHSTLLSSTCAGSLDGDVNAMIGMAARINCARSFL